ncbi:MAG TPA: Na+/H+ antiporter subunit E [Acidimicrobiales bacterium]|jgi:multisubunit Na+/H+ antiporter MnhE subunit|nr:Na+/H+ antiporter subunit E [Acidimicrobiales bacterium]
MLKTVSSVVVVAGGCLGIWLLSLSAVSNEELFVGSLCALLTGIAAVAAKRTTKVHWSVRAIPVRPLLRVPVAIVGDAVQVLLRPMPRVGRPAKVVTHDLEQRGDSAAATTRRVATALAVTSAPGSLVLDLDAESGRLTLHSLQMAGAHPEDALDER